MSTIRDKVNKLLNRIKKGQKDAFEELYICTYNHLKIVALNYLADSSNLDDVLNDAYLKAYKYCFSVDINKDGYNWLCKIVQNTAYDYNKRKMITYPINNIETHKFFYEIDDEILQNSMLLTVIRTFEDIEQKIIYLKFWEDLTYAEIAIRTNMKKPTVYKRMKKMLRAIEKYLGDGSKQK